MRRSQSPSRRMRACLPCSNARAKCHFQPANVERHLCDRCERLGVRCEAKTTAGLRRPRRIKEGDSQGITRSTSYELPTIPRSSDAALTQRLATTPIPTALPGKPKAAGNAAGTPRTGATGGTYQGRLTMKPPGEDELSSPSGLTWAQADHVLSIFRNKFMPNFPFVAVGEATSSRQLNEEKPMVFRSIMLVAAPVPVPRLGHMKRDVLAFVGQRLLVEDGRTLDMLQGLLICIAWASLNNLCDEQVTTLTYLALGCAHTLGITRVPIPILRKLGKRGKAQEDVRSSSKLETEKQKMHSLEEQRAFLGCFYVLAINSVHFGRKNPLGGQYVDICCDALAKAREYPTDFFLERAIRMTQMGETISGAFGGPNAPDRDERTYLDFLDGSSSGFRRELDRIMESLGDQQLYSQPLHTTLSSRQDLESRKGHFTLTYHYLTARLNEPATHLRAIEEQGGGPSALRSLRLRNCLVSVTAYLETLLTLPPESLLGQPLSFAEQATFVTVVATRLLLGEADARDWDVEKVRQTLDFSTIAGKVADLMEEAEAARRRGVDDFVEEMGVRVEEGEMGVEGRFAVMARNMRGIRDWFEARIRSEETGEASTWVEEEDIPEAWMPGLTHTIGQDMITGSGWYGGLLGNMAWNFDDMNI